MNFTLSEKDKKLLLVLAIVCVICIPYFFIIQPLMDKNTALETNITELQSRKRYLTDLALNEAVYVEKTKEAAEETQKLLAKFPSDIPQEATILFADNTEKLLQIRLQQVTYGEDVTAQIASQATEQQVQAVEEEMGYESEQPVVEAVSESVVISGNLTGMSTQTQYTFEAGYDEYLSFLDHVAGYNDRMVITGMTATYGLDVVTGNFTMMQYAIAGDGRPAVNVLEPNLMQGTTNVFLQAAGTGNSEAGAADFFMMLSRPDADINAVIIGQSGDASQNTYLTNNDNSQNEVTITFDGKDGQYTANYEIGSEAYSKEGVTFAKNGSILFEIISSERGAENDAVGVRLHLVNHTDVTLRVVVMDDDEENPRVKVASQTGVIALQ